MIELCNVTKSFRTAGDKLDAVSNVSLKIEKGDIYGIIGLSGAGKSTLVRCMNFLEQPTSGEVLFKGVSLASLSKKQLLETRRRIAMIFQGFNLLAQRTALRNVCYPLEICGTPHKQAEEKAKKLLSTVGLGDKLNAYPAQLSGGQKQRVAIARALATDPEVILCDEATSALDPTTTQQILELLKQINEQMNVTIVVITHEMRVVEKICNRVAVLDHGVVAEEGLVKDIFIAPKSNIARELVLPKNVPVKELNGGVLIRLAFDGQSATEPIISNLSVECGTAVNIMSADMKQLGGKSYGQMILMLPDDEDTIVRVRKYLDSRSVKFDELGKEAV